MNFLEQSKLIHQKYPNLLTAIFFLSGFIFDISTLGQIDEVGNFLGHTLYLVLLILSFLCLEQEYKYPWAKKVALYRMDIFHFICGGLLSAFAIFFFKSSSLSSSSLFIIVILVLLLANEAPIFQSRGSIVKLSLVQFCISAYFIIYIPVIIGIMGTTIFLITIILSGILLPIILERLKHPAVVDSKIISAAMIVILVIGYFSNVLPPVPLSIKEIGVYHNVIKLENSYNLYKESSFINSLGFSDTNFSALPGDKVYIFTRIFAPRGFKENLYIQWEKWDKTWKISDKIPLTIQGGNSWGYRAYTYKKNYSPGLWRAKVMSSDNREVGRIDFTISNSEKVERKWQIELAH